jgi:hypothetical protein
MKDIICLEGPIKVTKASVNMECFRTESETSETRSRRDEFYTAMIGTWQVNAKVTNSVEKSS